MSTAGNSSKGNLSIKAGGKILYSAKETYRVDGSTVKNSSLSAFQQKSGQGQTVRNEDKVAKVTPPPVTELRILKVEGPFDEKGNLAKEVIAGSYYTYKAIPNKKPESIAIATLQWAISMDGGEVLKVAGVAQHNTLEDGKIAVRIALNKDCKQAKVFAFFNQFKDDVQVTVTMKQLVFPILILQGSRRKGKNRQNTGTAEDMLYNDYPDNNAGIEKLRKELYQETYNVEKQDSWNSITNRADNAKSGSDYRIAKVRKFLKESDDKLFEIFRNDIGYYAMGEMEDVAHAMVDKMKSNAGGTYKNTILSQHVLEHESSKNFITSIRHVVGNYVKEHKGRIDQLEITDDGKGLLYDTLVKQNVSSPRFSDKFSGLGITINDVWAYQVYITKYERTGNTFKMGLRYLYFDHFGLDYPDIQKYDHDIFYAWFVLQHFKGYKPFITEIDLTGELKGTF